jgi:hypothetical protein
MAVAVVGIKRGGVFAKRHAAGTITLQLHNPLQRLRIFRQSRDHSHGFAWWHIHNEVRELGVAAHINHSPASLVPIGVLRITLRVEVLYLDLGLDLGAHLHAQPLCGLFGRVLLWRLASELTAVELILGA